MNLVEVDTLTVQVIVDVEDMKQFDLKMIIPAHCTGWRAVNAFRQCIW